MAKQKGADPAEQADRLSVYLESGAVIADPMSLPGLSARIEPEAVPIEGLPFDTKLTTRAKVDCALCGRQRNHYKGFVIDFADGRRAIVGRDCGESNLFDEGAWASMAASAERRKRAALYAARSAPTVAAIDALLPVLAQIHNEVGVIDGLLAEVARELPELHEGLLQAAGRGGELKRTVTRTVTVVGRDGKERTVQDAQSKTFASLPTTVPFAPGGLPAVVRRIARDLERLRAVIDREQLTLAEQAEGFRKLRSLGQDLREAHGEAEAAQRFLSPAFWEAVAQWGRADPYREGNYRVVRTTIRHSSKEEVFSEVTLPSADTLSLKGFEMARGMWPRL